MCFVNNSQRGFLINNRSNAGGATEIEFATEDIINMVDSMIEVNTGERDENGYSLEWDGALSRIKRELDYTFSYGIYYIYAYSFII